MGRRLVRGLVALGAALAVPGGAVAAGIPSGSTSVSVGPASIGPRTTVAASFRQPLTTGITQFQKLVEQVRMIGPSHSTCNGAAELTLPAARAGTAMHAILQPSLFGGAWCPGRYEAFLQLTISPRCGGTGMAVLCPQYVIAPRTLARFSFTVGAGH